jgi:arabinan endo-1,5-alpha-L-arabinosidase
LEARVKLPSFSKLVGSLEEGASRLVRGVEQTAAKTIDQLEGEVVDRLESAKAELAHVLSPSRPLYSNAKTQVAAADPGVIRVGNDYYLAHTGNGFPLLHSTDLVHWESAGSIFPPGQPSWAKGDFWAPEIHHVGDRYVAYFTARDREGTLRIGCATSPNVTGPYVDSGKPLASENGMGLIDPTFFHDPNSGKNFLVYKRDANAVKQPTDLMIQQLSDDGTQLVGEPKSILRNTLGWEGPLVEAPELTYRDGYYYLFYSANSYANDRYAEGVARSRSPFGPFEKHPDPILRSSAEWKGPGHGDLVNDASGQTWFVYHAWKAGQVGPHDGNQRMLLVDPIEWKNGWPRINDGHPSNGPRQGPATA